MCLFYIIAYETLFNFKLKVIAIAPRIQILKKKRMFVIQPSITKIELYTVKPQSEREVQGTAIISRL